MSNGYIGIHPKFASYPPEKVNAGATTKTLQYAPGTAAAIQVYVGSVIQQPDVAYTVAGNVVTFAEPLPYDGWITYRSLEDHTSKSMLNNDPVLSERWAQKPL